MNSPNYKNEVEQIVMTEYQMQFPMHKNISIKQVKPEQIIMFLFMAVKRLKGKPMDIKDFEVNDEAH